MTEEFTDSIELKRIMVIDQRGFHGTIIKYNENKYICIYHNSEEHRLASCFLDANYKYIEGTHVNDLGISKYIDPRIIKYNEQYYLSVSQLIVPETIYLWLLTVDEKITINTKVVISFNNILAWPNYSKGREKNWLPWEYQNRLFYTYSLNPHRILEVDPSTHQISLIYSTSWKSDLWWDKKEWVEPKYRLNAPPILLPNGKYLSIFHTMCMSNLVTNWHLIKPNYLLSYWTGFYIFDSVPPFKVEKISTKPFITPHYELPVDWPFHPPPSGGNPFYPFSILLEGDKIVLTGGSNEIALAYCMIPLNAIWDSLSPVISD